LLIDRAMKWALMVLALALGRLLTVSGSERLLPPGDLRVVAAPGKTVHFSGYEWRVKSGGGGPGPNAWDENNVWVDAAGALHLRIARRDSRFAHQSGAWTCAEVTMQEWLGFGCYEFQISGGIDRLDENVVLGLFNYPTREVGPDATHEIDIEFAKWGDAKNPIGNYTVWPVEKSLKQQTKSFACALAGDETTHRFTWTPNHILFESLRGSGTGAVEFSRWAYKPKDPAKRIARKPMPVHLNLWLFRGQPPKNGQEVEIVVRRFTFTPE
jgi:hypothetical protein